MITIPSNVVYFFLGFITAIVLLIAFSVYLVKKDYQRKEELAKSYMEIINSIEENGNEEEK